MKVLVIGDLGLDLVSRVDHLPREDGKSTGEIKYRGPGGMAANVAAALQRLGTPATLLAAIGDDDIGTEVLARLAEAGVDVSEVLVAADTGSFVCVAFVTHSGEKALVRLLSPAYLPPVEALTDELARRHDHLHFTLGDVALARHATEIGRRTHRTTSVDVETADLDRAPDDLDGILSQVDILFMNREAEEALERRAPGLLARRSQLVITTLGKEGSRARLGTHTINAAGIAVRPVDTTGAGDVFAAAFLHATAHDLPLGERLAFANTAASLSTLAYGAQGGLPDQEAVRAALAPGAPPLEPNHDA